MPGRWSSRLARRLLLHLRLLLLLECLVTPEIVAKNVFISTTGSDVPNCGATLGSACGSLGFALLSVTSTGDTLTLSPGTYSERGPTIVFGSTGRANVTIQSSTGDPEDVTIDREYSGRLFVFEEGCGAVRIIGLRFFRGGWRELAADKDYAGALLKLGAGDGDVVFEDCAFVGNLNPNSGYAGRGGVGAISAGAPRFTRCRFDDNWGGIAGAFHVANTATPVFEGCVFENSGCHQNGWGGAVVPEDQSAGLWRGCVFRNNTCNYGGAVDDGGIARPTFENCTFEANYARNLGGAYYGFGESQARFRGCHFVGNRVAKGGNGQDYYLSSSVRATFEDTVFDAGPAPVLVADGASGTVKDNSTLTLRGCTVSGYRAAYGAIVVTVTGRADFDSCRFTGNECVRGGALAIERPVRIRNCTFDDNVANEGGAIFLWSTTKEPMLVRIEGSRFVGNLGRSAGGAIKVTGVTRLELVDTLLEDNTATRVGGGAIFAMPQTELRINGSRLVGNRSPSGGAIWSEGLMVVGASAFVGNALIVDSVEDSGSCGLAAGSGGAIYAILSATTTWIGLGAEALSGSCRLDEALRMTGVTFTGNNASAGGGGAVFLDGALPVCEHAQTAATLCADCVFDGNVALYGRDLASAASAFELRSNTSRRWTLLGGNDVTIGATDLFGQALAGAHTPLVIRVMAVNPANASDGAFPVALVASTPRVMRVGDVTFKALALKLTGTTTNAIDRDVTLVFTSESSSSSSSSNAEGQGTGLTLALPLVLERCPQSGLVTADGRCLIEASGRDQELVAGVTVAAVTAGVVGFGLAWSYRHSQRVLETLQTIITGLGGVVVRLAFELLDLASDVQALVNLFQYDLTLAHPTVIRALYLTIFVMSLLPSMSLVRWTVLTVRAQWRRVLAHRIAALDGGNANDDRASADKRHRVRPRSRVAWRGSRGVGTAPAKATATGASSTSASSNRSGNTATSTTETWAEPTMSGSELREAEPTPTATTPSQPPRSRWDVPGALAHLERQRQLLEADLAFHKVRAQYMKRVLARLVTEDVLLLAFNAYIYFANRGDDHFARSRFRAALEYSMFLSGVHLGAQVQSIVTWLQQDKVGELRHQLHGLQRLRQHQPRANPHADGTGTIPGTDA